MYKGRWVYTIQPWDVGKRALNLDGRFIHTASFMGTIQVRDVGKQIWEHRGVYSVENQEQVEKRIRA